MDALTKAAAVAAGLVVLGAGWRWAAKKWTYGDTIIKLGIAALIIVPAALSIFR